MPEIHPSAAVSRKADLGQDVAVGAFALIEGGAIVGSGSVIGPHAVVHSGTRLGARTIVHAFAALGGAPQDRYYTGQPTRLEVGDDSVFHEHVTVHRGSARGEGVTRIGSRGRFMVGSHVAHDCLVGDGVTIANATLLGGHVHIGDWVVTGGGVAIAPFVRVGERSFIAAGAMVETDVPPFVIAAGDRATIRALNRIGLERTGVPDVSRAALKAAFRAIFRSRTPRARAAAALVGSPDPFVAALARWIATRQPSGGS